LLREQVLYSLVDSPMTALICAFFAIFSIKKSVSFYSLRALITTLAPSLRKACAVAFPKPDEAL